MSEAFAEYEIPYVSRPCVAISPTVCAPINPPIIGTDKHLGQINAAAAYARGATGEGETVAVLDSGINIDHREFSDMDFSGMGKVTRVTEPGHTGERGHGTFVSAVAAGNRDGGSNVGFNMQGVAFDAKLHVIEIALGAGGGPYIPYVASNHDDREFADSFNRYIASARSVSAVAMNLSFGVAGAVSRYSEAEVRDNFMLSAEALEQKNIRVADKTILVWAAGNAGSRTANGLFDAPELWAGLGVHFTQLRPHVLAVVALDQNGEIAGYSNHCGVAKSFCLAAPGSDIISADADRDDGYRLASGTSFAAPLVSGSLALISDFFDRQLGNTELAARLLATANRTGIYADSDIYGHGLLDLDAATRPVGTLMTGLPGDIGSRPLIGSSMALSGTAFGGSLQKSLATLSITGFDALGAPFSQSMASWVTPSQLKINSHSYHQQRKELRLPLSPYQDNGATMSLGINPNGTINDTRLALANGWWVSYGYHGGRALGLYAATRNGLEHTLQRHNFSANTQLFSNPMLFAAPYLSLVSDGFGMGWVDKNNRMGFALMHGTPQFHNEYKRGGRGGVGAALDFALDNGLSLQAGAVHESDGFLGARLKGALGRAQSMTTFVGANGKWRLANDWQLLTSAYFGYTRQQVLGSSLLNADGAILSSAFSIGTMRTSIWHDNDSLGLRLSQPLRVESGKMQLRNPVGRTKYGKIITQRHELNLSPTGRNIQAEVAYHHPYSNGILKTSIGAEYNSEHGIQNGTQPFVRLSLERRF